MPRNTRLKPYTTRMAKIQGPKEGKTYSNIYKDKRAHAWPMGSKSTLRLMRTLGPFLGSLAQSTWSLLPNALAG